MPSETDFYERQSIRCFDFTTKDFLKLIDFIESLAVKMHVGDGETLSVFLGRRQAGIQVVMATTDRSPWFWLPNQIGFRWFETELRAEMTETEALDARDDLCKIIFTAIDAFNNNE